MKLNFKRIASVLTGAVMLSSTVALAAAANFPAPFSSNNGADAAVVFGATALQSDMVAAGKVATAISQANVAAATSTSTSTTTATVTGETKAVKSGTQDLYLGTTMSALKSSFDNDELPTVLKDSTITDTSGTSSDITQKILVPNSKVIYGEASDDEDIPTLYADFANSESYTLEVSFSPAVNVTKLRDKNIKLFGKDYTFSGDADDLTNESITLFERSQSTRINDGESKTVGDHTISVSVEDSSSGTVTVDGESESVTEANSYTINGVDIYVKNVVGPSVAGTSRYMEVYLNSNQVKLDNGEAVKLGSAEEDIEGTVATITSTAGKVRTISIAVTPESVDVEPEVENIALGQAFVDPVFKTVKFSLASPALNESGRDEVVIKATGDQKASIEFTNAAGKDYNFEMFVPSTEAIDDTYTSMMLGNDNDDVAIAASTNISEEGYVVTCDEEYSQIWRVTDIDLGTDQEVTFDDLASGEGTTKVSLSGVTASSTGELALASGNDATVTLTATSPATVTVSAACAQLYTEGGAKIDLTYADAYTASGANSSVITFTEETDYNEGDYKNISGAATNLGTIPAYNISLKYDAGRTGKDTVVDVLAYGNGWYTWTDDVGDDDNYYLSQYGTWLKATGDTDTTVSIFYPTEAMALGFYIGEVASAVDDGEDGGDVGGSLLLKDNEVAKFENKNLVVVGGSCINTVASRLLGGTAPICGADFSAKAGVNAGEYLIATYQSPYNTAKVATLVAGYDAADTEAAVNFLTTGSNAVNTSVGSSMVKKTQLSVS